MENVDNLAEPAGRLSQSTTLRACYVPALVKGSMAWLLCLPVGQALPLASSYRSTLFFFRRETNGSNEPSSASSDRAKAAFRMVSSRSFGNDHLIHPTVAAVAGVQRIAAIVDRPHLCRDLGVA